MDGHQAVGWRVHDNVIAGFWCTTGLSEHGEAVSRAQAVVFLVTTFGLSTA
jgi:hypothetical protein